MNAVFNLIRETDQFIDCLHVPDARERDLHVRVLKKLYTITVIGISILGILASVLESTKDPAALLLRGYETYERGFLCLLTAFVPSTNETKKNFRFNLIALTNLGLSTFFPQYRTIHMVWLVFEAACRLTWIYDRKQQLT